MKKLNGETLVLIGSTGGIGSAILEELTNDTVNLVLASNQPELLKEQTAAEEAKGHKVFARELDVTDEAAVKSFLSDAKVQLGSLDTLINLAGLSIPGKVQDLDVEKFDLMMDVNVKGTFLTSKHFLNLVDVEKGGAIINFASMASKRANGGAPLYCAAKSAVSMMSQATQINAIEKNVKVSNVCPGAADSPFWGDRKVPRELFLKTKDVAEVIYFILTRESNVVIQDIEFESFDKMK
jgi:NADP-dependent 3-hydroxy acid dehydrogenase YdfG